MTPTIPDVDPTTVQTDEISESDLDQIADVLHQFWWHWSVMIAQEEDISDERLGRWEESWKAYERLDESEKESDRDRARAILRVVDRL